MQQLVCCDQVDLVNLKIIQIIIKKKLIIKLRKNVTK